MEQTKEGRIGVLALNGCSVTWDGQVLERRQRSKDIVKKQCRELEFPSSCAASEAGMCRVYSRTAKASVAKAE